MTFNWFNKLLHPDNQNNKYNDEGGNDMSHQAIGTFTCESCDSINVDPKIMDIDVDDESKGSLILCFSCDKWVRWI